MEFFNHNSKAIGQLVDCSFSNIALNYQTLHGYTNNLYQQSLPLNHLR